MTWFAYPSVSPSKMGSRNPKRKAGQGDVYAPYYGSSKAGN